MDRSTVCPWCQTEIVWDEELGPENVCPYCENELGDYRTVSIELERDDDDAEREDGDAASGGRAGTDAARKGKDDGRPGVKPEPVDLDGRIPDDLDPDGFRPINARLVALEGKLEAVLNEQLEVPECPSCREYMIEAGTQTVGPDGWEATVHPAVTKALLPAPFRLTWYVCPNCHFMHSRLAPEDRERLLSNLEADD